MFVFIWQLVSKNFQSCADKPVWENSVLKHKDKLVEKENKVERKTYRQKGSVHSCKVVISGMWDIYSAE